MEIKKVYDVIGIGIGPFNLGLAALVHDIKELDCLFIDKNESFHWHPGLLLPTAKMQVPFYADLVTLADPTSRFTYMNYLKETCKLFRFAINESYFPYRSEYNAYCQWVASQLKNLLFDCACTFITYEAADNMYHVHTSGGSILYAKHIVIGVGASPKIPACTKKIDHPLVFHTGEYLHRRHAALMHNKITIIGSGQSAAEIFLDMLPHMDNLEQLQWFTRSDRFHPMDYSKLSLEMSSPDYISYFYTLDPQKKKQALLEQQYLYRGINFSLINTIYEELYLRSLDANKRMPLIRTNCDLVAIDQLNDRDFQLLFYQHEQEKEFTLDSNAVILATGYENVIPDFLQGLHDQIEWTGDGLYTVKENYSIDRHNTIFVQNAEKHTHGFNTADLGLGPYRNAVITNGILRKEYFHMASQNTFQQFG